MYVIPGFDLTGTGWNLGLIFIPWLDQSFTPVEWNLDWSAWKTSSITAIQKCSKTFKLTHTNNFDHVINVRMKYWDKMVQCYLPTARSITRHSVACDWSDCRWTWQAVFHTPALLLTVSSRVYAQIVSSEIRMKGGVGVIASHVLHWVTTNLKARFDANKGMHAVQNWAYRREDTVIPKLLA